MGQDTFQSRRGLRRRDQPAKMPRWGLAALIVPSSARRWPRCCGSSGCWELRSLPLSLTDYAPSIKGGLPSAAPASVGTERHPHSQLTPASHRPRRGKIFHLLYSYPGACRPASKDAGDSGSRALAPPVFGQGTVFIGVVLLRSGVGVIITYLLRSVNTQLIRKSHINSKNCGGMRCEKMRMTHEEPP
jgi:hypothetical protein